MKNSESDTKISVELADNGLLDETAGRSIFGAGDFNAVAKVFSTG
jgi:hypothetical protein